MTTANPLRQFEDGDEVCSIYDFHIETAAGAGSVTMTEWNVVHGGHLQSVHLAFDTAAIAARLPS